MTPPEGSNRIEKLLTHPRIKKPAEDMATDRAIPPETVNEVRQLFDRYAAEVEQTSLSPSTKAMYIDHASYFVRWMYGGFVPGAEEDRLRWRGYSATRKR